MPIINTTCIVIVVISFILVMAYMIVVHKFIKDAESNDGKSDSSHH